MNIHFKTTFAAFAANALCAGVALAEVSDPPYFNLWAPGTTINGQTGQGTTVTLCGTQACGANDFARFSVFNGMPTGTGFINPFLRFQHTEGPEFNGSTRTEAAYNTDARDAPGTYQLQDTGDPGSVFTNRAKDHVNFNRAITIGSLDRSDGFLHFFLDINEPASPSGRTLKLDELQFFVSSSPVLDRYVPDAPDPNGNQNPEVTGALAGADKVWDMDWDLAAPSPQQNCVTMQGNTPVASPCGGLVLDNVNDSGGGAGSGDYDLHVALPFALFANFADTDYIYLYNFMGDADARAFGEAEAGFEEWAALTRTAPGDDGGGNNNQVPEPATFLLIGTAAALIGRRRQATPSGDPAR